MRLMLRFFGVLLTLVGCFATAEEVKTKPNVLFISIDDLNDWIGVMGGHPQALTPNFDRLAASGMLFTNAHCAAASCNPSRSAIFTGVPCNVSGLYTNRQKMRKVFPDAELIPAYFRRHGYRPMGSGKMLHYFIDARSWDEYYPKKETENPFPPTFYPPKKDRPINFPYEKWMYVEADWMELPVDDKTFGGDYSVSEWVGKKLRQKHDKPFFLACGIYRPHEPWFIPEKYYKPFPLDKLQLPPGYKEGDLDDLPPLGKRMGPNRYFKLLREHNQWKPGVRAYLASIHFADAMLGRVLDALEEGPNKDNTIVVLWSDHGWHLGEKEHWQKFTGWRACTRVPLMVRVPKGAPGLPQGTTAGKVCDQPVSLLDLYKTLNQLAGLPAKEGIYGDSLVPLLADPQAEWRDVAITYLDYPGNYALSGKGWRYIHYHKGGEELYNIEEDPYEWTNLAGKQQYLAKLQEFRKLKPKKLAPKVNTD